jgi:hypothetical protein
VGTAQSTTVPEIEQSYSKDNHNGGAAPRKCLGRFIPDFRFWPLNVYVLEPPIGIPSALFPFKVSRLGSLRPIAVAPTPFVVS